MNQKKSLFPFHAKTRLKGGANGMRGKDDGKSDDSISREEFKWCQRSVSGGMELKGGPNGGRGEVLTRPNFRNCL